MKTWLLTTSLLVPCAALAASSGPPSVPIGGSADTNTVKARGATVALPEATRAGRVLTLEEFRQPGDVDDGPSLAAAYAAATSPLNTQGGRIALLRKVYTLGSGGTIPAGCDVEGPGNSGNDGPGYNAAAILPRVVLGAGSTLSVNGDASGFALARAGVNLVPPHIQDAMANLANYSGVGMTIGQSAHVHDIITLGNALGYQVEGAAQWHAYNLRSDDLAGISLDNVHDVSTVRDFEAWPWLSASDGVQTLSAGIVNVAPNGSGNLRVTTATAHGLVVGNPVTVSGVGGMTGANGRWTVLALVDATHFDISASSAPTTTGTLTTDSYNVAVASTVGLAYGQGVSGTGIPSGTIIWAVQPDTNTIQISSTPTAAGSGVQLTFSQTAYTAPASGSTNGTVTLLAWERPGACITDTNSESLTFDNGFCFGHQVGMHLGNGSGWFTVDHFQAEGGDGYNPASVGLLIDGTAYSAKVHLGGDFAAFWSSVEINLSNPGGNTEPVLISGGPLYAQRQPSYGPSALRVVSGNAIISNATSVQGDIFIGQSAHLQLVDSDASGFFGFGNQGYGTTLANLDTAGTRFSDTPMTTLRGGQGAALSVPNAAGNGYVFPVQVRSDGTPVVGTDGSQGNAQLLVKGYQASAPSLGAQIVFWNTAPGAATPFKFMSVGADGSWGLLSADYSRKLIKADDNGDVTFSRHVVNAGTPLTAANLSNCGTNPAINGNDRRGTVTPGAGATGCVVNLLYTYPTYPFATLTPGAPSMNLYGSYTNNNQLVVGFSTPGPFTYVLEQ